MDQELCQIELIKRARRGDRQSLDQLAEQARERLRTYVYRLTQRDDLAQEIVQESLLEMYKVIGKLQKADRFWPWLYGIAVNKLRRYYRTEQAQRKVAASSAIRKGTPKQRADGLETLVSEELKQIISTAMQKLRTRHKAVLIMRCYDEMAYSEIAESMDCSEFSSRMLFVRAKKALQRELARNGFGKGSLLAALIVFGKMTAPSKAAAAQLTVAAASTKVGVLAGVAALATTKTAIISLTAAGALTVGTMVAPPALWKQDAEGPGSSAASPPVVSQFGQDSNANEEYWYYFPQGPAKPMMLRARFGAVGEGSHWQILQNDYANYHYRNNSVYINNHRMWAGDLSVPKLPTDKPELTDFLCQVEQSTRPVRHVAATGEGLLVIAARTEADGDNRPWAVRHRNVLDEDYFQPDWPATARIFDNRDLMHKRGWTYFRVTGQLNGEKVSGTGRIPFVYAASAQYSPWLKLQVGSLRIVDTYKQAYLDQSSPEKFATYGGGSFFKGLARPWMGLHTVDTVRRDAAEQRVRFLTRHTPGSRLAQVELVSDGVKLVYKIDLEADVINEITFSTDQGSTGNLKFSYLQSVDGVHGEFVPPAGPSRRTTRKPGPGMLWLARLMDSR